MKDVYAFWSVNNATWVADAPGCLFCLAMLRLLHPSGDFFFFINPGMLIRHSRNDLQQQQQRQQQLHVTHVLLRRGFGLTEPQKFSGSER